ncbi:MAG: hypothetical protein FJ130_11760 [Deltaproteobacteria bacterium]|nr:hypothetical protein [Deltaproteobacteria bacterium]
MHKFSTTVCVASVALVIGFILGFFFRPILAFILVYSAGAKLTDDFANIIIGMLSILFSGIVGYLVGSVKSFREEKQRAYGELLPPIVRMAYNPTPW